MSTVFFTGFPGFIGKRLVEKILEKSQKIYLLVFPSMKNMARKSIEDIELKTGIKNRIVLVEGDITQENLGLPTNMLDELKSCVTDIFHLAAIYNLDVPKKISQSINIDGTRNTLEFSKNIKSLKKFNYYSTCYVSGLYKGTFYENDLDKGQKFKNFYEYTKFEAEKLAREYMKEMPLTIFRPGIVVGDSKTGETDKYDGPYISFKLFKKGLHIFRPGNGDVAINLVPIDFIIDSTMFLAYLESSIGKTFALCDPNPIQFKEFLNLTADIYPAKKFFITIPPVALKMSLSLPGISSWLEIQKNSIDYANHHVIYDCTQTCEEIGRAHV